MGNAGGTLHSNRSKIDPVIDHRGKILDVLIPEVTGQHKGVTTTRYREFPAGQLSGELIKEGDLATLAMSFGYRVTWNHNVQVSLHGMSPSSKATDVEVMSRLHAEAVRQVSECFYGAAREKALMLRAAVLADNRAEALEIATELIEALR